MLLGLMARLSRKIQALNSFEQPSSSKQTTLLLIIYDETD